MENYSLETETPQSTEGLGLPTMPCSPFFIDSGLTLWNADCMEVWSSLAACPAIILDPPFDKWESVPWFPNETKICFTNPQNREHVTAKYGKPRAELVWYFKDGRWTSHKLPRTTHEYILIYGSTGESYVGEVNSDRTPRKKGKGAVGRDSMPEREWVPRERKALNSVLEYPRNVRGEMGCWGKPVPLMRDLLAWVGSPLVADAFAGGCSAAIAARSLGIRVLACEIEEATCKSAIKRLNQTEMILP